MKKTKSNQNNYYCCPICSVPLSIEWGDGIHRNDKSFGGSLFCPSIKCTAQEVKGHGNGKSEQTILTNAYEIIMAKMTGAKMNFSADETDEPESKIAVVDDSDIL